MFLCIQCNIINERTSSGKKLHWQYFFGVVFASFSIPSLALLFFFSCSLQTFSMFLSMHTYIYMYVCMYVSCMYASIWNVLYAFAYAVGWWLDGCGGVLGATRTIFKLSPPSFDNKNNNNYNKTNKCDNIAPQNIELFFAPLCFLLLLLLQQIWLLLLLLLLLHLIVYKPRLPLSLLLHHHLLCKFFLLFSIWANRTGYQRTGGTRANK